LSDEEIEDELRRSQDMATAIRRMSDKNQGVKTKQRPSSASVTYIPPKFGTSNTSRKIQMRSLEKDFQNAENLNQSHNNRSSNNNKVDSKDLEHDAPIKSSKSEKVLISSLTDLNLKYQKNLMAMEKL
jgi:hypothetical protein